jgi:predicted SnoaL-like aldol condensation-catalyzing enzyme
MSDAHALRAQVQAAMDAILVAHDRAAVRRHFHPDFVQHNPWAEDGGAHVEQMCDFTFGVEMKRWAVQGDIVAYHGLYTAPNPLGDQPLLCVDLWRVQGDRIVEHWDALQPVPAAVAEIMLAGEGDGFVERTPDQVAAQAASARRMYELGVNTGDVDSVKAVIASDFAVHLPNIDAAAGHETWLMWMQKAQPQVVVKRTIAAGDLVFVQMAITAQGEEQAGYHILRFNADGRATDVWLVMQDRVAVADAANPHPHF